MKNQTVISKETEVENQKDLILKIINLINTKDKVHFSRLGKKRNLELTNKIGCSLQGSKTELEELYKEVKEFHDTIRNNKFGLEKGLILSKEDYLKDELIFLKKYKLDNNPTYNDLIKAEVEKEHFIDSALIFDKQAEYLTSELTYLKNQRNQLQSDANHIKGMRDGGHPFETTGLVMHINQVIRALNDKFNFNNLYSSGGRPHNNGEQPFYLNDDCNLVFFDGHVVTELHHYSDAADSFKAVYDIAVANLKAHLKESKLSKKEKAFYTNF